MVFYQQSIAAGAKHLLDVLGAQPHIRKILGEYLMVHSERAVWEKLLKESCFLGVLGLLKRKSKEVLKS